MLICFFFRRRSRLFERRSLRRTRCHWWEAVPTLAWPRRRRPGVPTSTLTRSWPTPSALRPCRLPTCLVLQSTPLPWQGRYLYVSLIYHVLYHRPNSPWHQQASLPTCLPPPPPPPPSTPVGGLAGLPPNHPFLQDYAMLVLQNMNRLQQQVKSSKSAQILLELLSGCPTTFSATSSRG